MMDTTKNPFATSQRMVIVFYAPVGNMSQQRAQEALGSLTETLNMDRDDNEKYIVVPTQGAAKVEVLNPVRISDDEYEEVISRVETLEHTLDTYLSNDAHEDGDVEYPYGDFNATGEDMDYDD